MSELAVYIAEVMQNYRKLNVWRSTHSFILDVYATTKAFPGDERYGLVSQLRRSSTSVAMNIAEGSMRSSPSAFALFLEIASSSATECDCQLLIARDLGFLNPEEYTKLVGDLTSIRRRLAALRNEVLRASRVDARPRKPQSINQKPPAVTR